MTYFCVTQLHRLPRELTGVAFGDLLEDMAAWASVESKNTKRT